VTPPGQGEAVALQRRLAADPDRLALYGRLSDGGAREDMFLLERNVGPSMLMASAAVRAECRGELVTIVALSPNGPQVLAHVAAQLSQRLISSHPDRLVLRFPATQSQDSEARLLAPSPLDAVRALTSFSSRSVEEPFTVTAPGIVSFDYAGLSEDLPANAEDPLNFPDFIFWLADALIVFEQGARPRLLCTAFGSNDPETARRSHFDAAERLADLFRTCEEPFAASEPPAEVSASISPEVDLDDRSYGAVVSSLREEIARGEIYQIVPSRTFRAPCPDPIGSYAALRQFEPSPYRFFVKGPGFTLFGASPETAVRVYHEDGLKTVEVKPIAGTRGRGATADEDDRLEAEMRLDRKELAEHMMLVDLARNDVARVSVAGTRRVARLMSVERYARVMHLVSSVTGTLRLGLDALHALQACLNVGTLTGAPKIRAMELLRLTERTKRGPYGGAIGWVNGEGLMDTGVVIRSAVVKDGTAFVRAGAGVVHDSDPQLEADETRRKASALLGILAATGSRT